MNINRHNYEEHFILYMDNELSSEDRRRVEEFMEQNPDLREEMDTLLQSQLTPDPGVVFSGKQELLKVDGFSPITLLNYDEWLVMYIDGELSPEQNKQVEQFASLYPSVQKELEQFRQVRLQPETIVFPGKETLYRKTAKVRVLEISWRRIAVAAVLLLAITITAVFLMNNRSNREEPVANNPVQQKPAVENAVVNNKINTNEESTVNDKNTTTKKEVNTLPNTIAVKQNSNSQDKKRILTIPEQLKKEVPVVADNSKTNDLPKTSNVADLLNDNTNDVATIKKPTPHVTPPTDQSLITTYAVLKTSVSETNGDETADSKKGGIRGLLRKVTRTFEKTTNINTTDDDRLLVGGLAIKLK
jgi:Tfp pilus assembly protein PilV